MNDVKTLKVC